MSTANSSVIRHYFDWAATAIPCFPPAGGEICHECGSTAPYGNPSSRHSEGRIARKILEDARTHCAQVLGVKSETLYFTSGGTEANCIALYSNLLRPSGRIVSSRAEHPSITENIDTLQRLGRLCGVLPVDSAGRVTGELLQKTIEKYGDVRFAAIMAINNETGVITDLASVRNVLDIHTGAPVHFHCDMVQAVGKMPINLDNCDSASLSAHKIGGPRGIGLLYLKKPLEALYSGGGQEGKIRPGIENVAGAAALAACLEQTANRQTIQAHYEEASKRIKRLITALSETGRCLLIPAERSSCEELFSPYIVQLGFTGIPGEVMVRAMDDRGFAVSTGSACSSTAPGRPALTAMGIDEQISRLGIRISQGWTTSDEEIESLIDAIKGALQYL
jgi:cysteine desulfurase